MTDSLDYLLGFDHHDDELTQMITESNISANPVAFATSENITESLAYVNQSLAGFGFPPLYGKDPSDAVQTVNCVYAILSRLKVYFDRIEEYEEKVRKLQSDLKQSISYHTRTKEQLKLKCRDLDLAENRCSELEKKLRQQKKAFTAERDDLSKQVVKLQHQQMQYRHNIKKRELESNRLQERLSSLVADRYRTPIPSFDMTQAIGERGSSFSHGDDAYQAMIIDAYQTKIDELKDDNDRLRSSVAGLENDLSRAMAQAPSPSQPHTPARRHLAVSALSGLPPQLLNEALKGRMEKLRSRLLSRAGKGKENVDSNVMDCSMMDEMQEIIDGYEEVVWNMMVTPNTPVASPSPGLEDRKNSLVKKEKELRVLQEELRREKEALRHEKDSLRRQRSALREDVSHQFESPARSVHVGEYNTPQALKALGLDISPAQFRSMLQWPVERGSPTQPDLTP